MTIRKALIAKIHIAKKDLALDDETYRQVLVLASNGKSSCVQMNSAELGLVVDHFKKSGWKPKRANARKYSPKTRHKNVHDQVDKIRAIWIDIGAAGGLCDASEAALDKWVKRTTIKFNNGIGIDRIDWLRNANPTLITKVLESIKQWRKRLKPL